jgi:hypothetical protein
VDPVVVEVALGFVPTRLDLKPLRLGLAVLRTVFRCAFRTVLAGGAFAGSPKVDDVPHSEGSTVAG